MSTMTTESTALRFHVAPRRDIDAAVLSDMGWIEGTFVVPKLHGFVDYLNNATGYLKLTRASFAGLEEKLPFLALAQGAYTLVIPSDNDGRLESPPPTVSRKRHRVSCIFSSGWVSGTLETLESLRVSDVLTNSKPFFLLRDCTINVRGVAKRAPLAIVNGACLVGVSEPSIEEVRKKKA